MNTHFNDVKLFTKHFKLPFNYGSFSFLEKDLFLFRLAFLREEFQEYNDSFKNADLATAIDSLIDLMYIVCGTFIFHGCTEEEFNQSCKNSKSKFADSNRYLMSKNLKLDFLNYQTNQLLTMMIDQEIRHYEILHNVDKTEALNSLSNVYNICMLACECMGMSKLCIDEFWSDVQRANMSKIRALKDEDSKRGSAKFDIIKPVGWIGAKSEELVAKWQPAIKINKMMTNE